MPECLERCPRAGESCDACILAGTSTGGILATFLATKGAKVSEAKNNDSPLAQDLKQLLLNLPTDPSKTAGKEARYWQEKYNIDALSQGATL